MGLLGVISLTTFMLVGGAAGGFWLRKRTSGWCPTCGGPALDLPNADVVRRESRSR